MGLAASQARFLGLTARKTNVEYEGQQVNQQRTALANQSANLFNEMLTLEVPTPPMANDYSKSEYVFTNQATSEQVTISKILKNPVEEGQPQTYTIDGTIDRADYASSAINLVYNGTGNNGYNIKADGDPVKYSISIGGRDYLELTGPAMCAALVDKFNSAPNSNGNNSADDLFYQYTNTQTGITYYINATTTGFDPSMDSFPAELQVYSSESYTREDTFHVDNAQLTNAADGTGRFTTITFTDPDTGEQITCSMTMQTTQDDDAFDEAMDEYNAKKAEYDKRIAEIDAQTVIIQQQDKNLELHLNQLDTEQQAIQTELDAVKKVIDKNIEETFKTFA